MHKGQIAAHFHVVGGTVVKWTISGAELVIEGLQELYVQWPGPEEQRDIERRGREGAAVRNLHCILVYNFQAGLGWSLRM